MVFVFINFKFIKHLFLYALFPPSALPVHKPSYFLVFNFQSVFLFWNTLQNIPFSWTPLTLLINKYWYEQEHNDSAGLYCREAGRTKQCCSSYRQDSSVSNQVSIVYIQYTVPWLILILAYFFNVKLDLFIYLLILVNIFNVWLNLFIYPD